MRIYCTTFCNKGHDLDDGMPVEHECRWIPPAALQAEREDKFSLAIEIMERCPRVTHRGKRDRTR